MFVGGIAVESVEETGADVVVCVLGGMEVAGGTR